MQNNLFLWRTILFYAGALLWVFGWLTAVFGLWHAFLAVILVAFPLFVAVRMAKSDQSVRRREYVYLGVLTILALVGTGFLVLVWYDYGLHRPVAFQRDMWFLRRYLATKPEYEHVDVSYDTGFKGLGLHVVLSGSVRTRKVHDELVEAVNRSFRYNDSIRDGVMYWGRDKEANEKDETLGEDEAETD